MRNEERFNFLGEKKLESGREAIMKKYVKNKTKLKQKVC